MILTNVGTPTSHSDTLYLHKGILKIKLDPHTSPLTTIVSYFVNTSDFD